MWIEIGSSVKEVNDWYSMGKRIITILQVSLQKSAAENFHTAQNLTWRFWSVDDCALVSNLQITCKPTNRFK